MYNKLFTKILDSSVWLESITTRIVWLTLIASMDEDGFAAFAAMGNLANRARVAMSACEQAVKVLESPDPESADPDFEGRRIERVPGGWIVLNASKYRDLVTRIVARERTKERVRKHRAKAHVTVSNGGVTPSEARASALAPSDTRAKSATALTTTNPHAKTTNLVNGSDLRRHGSHAWCDHSRGLCVPPSLHDEFQKRGVKTSDEMKAWYPTVIDALGQMPVGDDVFDFWRSAFAHWIGTVAVKPRTRQMTRGEESVAAAGRLMARLEGK